MAERNYRYSLEKGSKHHVCPKCGKKTFKLYVDNRTGIPAGEQYGRCERINSCKYNNYPRNTRNSRNMKNDNRDFTQYETDRSKIVEQKKELDYVSDEIVEKTFSCYKQNVFFKYLVKLFGIDKAYELAEKYNIGTAKGGGTVFWQEDKNGRFRTGKVMYYGEDGHRLKNRKSWFVHAKIKKDFNYRQCFFGLHLTTDDKPVALCESEKTAIIMSVFEPQYTWVASGGASMLSDERLLELPRLDKVYADNGQFEQWRRRTSHFAGCAMDTDVEEAVKDGIIAPGSDILDLYLLRLAEYAKLEEDVKKNHSDGVFSYAVDIKYIGALFEK